MMHCPDLGIVILNYNTFDLVFKCVTNILEYYIQGIRIVVVDNQSTDKSFQLLNENIHNWPYVDLLRTEYNGGYSYGNNIGIKHLFGNYSEIKYVAILNPDVLINSNTIFQNLIYRLKEDESLAGISPLMILNNYAKPERWAIKLPYYVDNFLSSFVILRSVNPLLYKSFEINPLNHVAYVDVLPGSFFIIKKDVFSNINLFDERVFLYGEEIILARKIKDLRLKSGLLFNEFYFHNHYKNSVSFVKKLFLFKHSIKSHIYFNLHYTNKLWGILDSILLIIFIPLRVFELVVIHLCQRQQE